MSAYGRDHPVHCGCVMSLRSIADDLIASIEQPATGGDEWAEQLDAAVARAKERLEEVRGGR